MYLEAPVRLAQIFMYCLHSSQYICPTGVLDLVVLRGISQPLSDLPGCALTEPHRLGLGACVARWATRRVLVYAARCPCARSRTRSKGGRPGATEACCRVTVVAVGPKGRRGRLFSRRKRGGVAK